MSQLAPLPSVYPENARNPGAVVAVMVEPPYVKLGALYTPTSVHAVVTPDPVHAIWVSGVAPETSPVHRIPPANGHTALNADCSVMPVETVTHVDDAVTLVGAEFRPNLITLDPRAAYH